MFLWGYVDRCPFIVWRLWSIYFDHHLPLKPSIGKRRKQSCTPNSSIMINIRLNGIWTDLELDTASDNSFITSNAWKKLGCPKFHPNNKKFEKKHTLGRSLSQEERFFVPLNTISSQLVISVSKGFCLFGRDLLRKVQMDWTEI